MISGLPTIFCWNLWGKKSCNIYRTAIKARP